MIYLLIFLLNLNLAEAKEFPAQGRIFGGAIQADPKDVNTELAAQSLKEMDTVPQIGVEITYPLLKFLDVGMRYSRRGTVYDEETPSPTTEYEAEFKQDAILLLARVPLLKTSLLHVDVFGGVGGTNTTLKIKSATQDGEISKKESGDWVAAPYFSYGASFAIGYKWIYLFFEGGMESNKIEDFKRTGNVNNNIETIDLSGSYVSIGLMFDGIKATK